LPRGINPGKREGSRKMKRADMEKDIYRENQGYREQGEKSKYKERIQRDKERNPGTNPAIFAHGFLCFCLHLLHKVHW
jgi:hypothetical protein